MDWWPNPEYRSTTEGQGLFSSYKFKGVEFFLLDNRSFRNGIPQQLGPEQLEWLKQALLNSTADFKILISGTPSFDKSWGGRNFSITAEANELIQFIKEKHIDGVMSFSADIHEQAFFGRYGDVAYPLYDVLSGNLNSDVGSGQFSVNYANDQILRGTRQTYLRTNVYGDGGDRRLKLEYVGLNGQPYFETVIHADMLKSIDDSTRKFAFSFSGSLKDSSAFDHTAQATGITYGADRAGTANAAAVFSGASSIQVPYSKGFDLHDRAFSLGYWVNAASLAAAGEAIFSNGSITVGFDKDGYPQYTDHTTKVSYTATQKIIVNKWVHINWKYDNVKRQLSLYYNGLLLQTWQGVASPATSTVAVTIGNNAENKPFTGSLDEVKLYGKLISDAAIQDESGYTSHRGNVLKLAGASSMVIPSSALNPALSGNFTIEFWGKLNSDPGTNFKILASNARVNNNTTGLSFEFQDNNKLNVVAGTNTANWNSLSDKGDIWKIGEWNHVAVTGTTDGSLTYYVNGEKIAEAAFTAYVNNTTGMGLGFSPAYGTNVAGEMDELRIWNIAVPQDSIRKRMHYPLTGNESGLQLYYDFSEKDNNTIVSKGAQKTAIALNGGELFPATSPVADITPAYQQSVAASWSRRNTANAGLSFPDNITSYTANIVHGKDNDATLAQTAAGIYYLKGGWQIDPLNNPFATVKVNLAQALPHADSIIKSAGVYYLLQEVKDSLVNIGEGTFDGQQVSFFNTFLEEGIYHLGWKADTTGAIGRGGAISLPGGHQVYIPAAKANPVLTGPFTIEMWARLMQDPATGGKLLSNSGRVSNNSTGLAFEFTDQNSLNAVLGTNGSGWNTVATNKPWKIGEWNHVAITAAPNTTVKVYINGELAGSNAYANFAPNTNWALALGTSINYGGAVVAMMDEYRMWNRVKTPEEIKTQMHQTITDADASLVYNFTFNQEDIGKVINTGTAGDTITTVNAQIIPATSPAGVIEAAYRDIVTAGWSVKNETENGLYLKDAITDFTKNVIFGRDLDNSVVKLANTKDTFYVKGPWLLNAQNLDAGNLYVDLGKIFSNPDSISQFAGKYFLIKGEPTADYKIVATGKETANVIDFGNVALDFGKYYFAYKASVVPVEGTYTIGAGSDDAEQDITAGTMYLTSSDIELTKDGASDQLSGLRFTGVNIPQGAVITKANIQFTVDEVNTDGNVNVLIGIEHTDNPLTMSTFDYDIYHRIVYYGDTVIWKPGPFAKVGDAGADQRTPDLSGLLQTVVDRPNWKPGNAVLFTLIDPAAADIPGYTANTARRVAQAYENNAANAAKLVVSYYIPNKYYNGTFPVPAKASWKYNDKGIDMKDSSWTAVNYNDTAWAFGNAILGYGDGNETTTLDFGDDANNKRPTYYLRHIFKVDDYTQYDSLLFDVLRDDGAIVYVNGKEAFRMNMPAGPVGYNTYASAAVNDGDETKYFRAKTANLLQNGLNVIAVELHQSVANSSDLSFDMSVGFELPPLKPATYPLSKNSHWYYLDNGESLDNIAWKDTTYQGTKWAQGQGPLGYGDPMSTTIGYGPDANNKYVTYYFRRAINIDTAALPDDVEIGVRRDDGVVLYVNGEEVVRDNMPAGNFDYKTFSATTVDGTPESTYYTFRLPKSIFRQGKNQLAAEVHNRSLSSSDIGFDMYIKDAPRLNPPSDCNGKHISCFTSIVPTGPTDKLIIADAHRFQMIFKQGEMYTNGAGEVPGNQDYTSYLPVNGSSELGHLSVNHENTPGGVSMLDIHFNDSARLWMVDTSQPVDLYNTNLITTTRNCSGGTTPWGTVITCEESLNSGDVNGDGYEDVGWAVEIDPVTSKVIDYDHDGKQDKLWALGRMNHENVVVSNDRKTVYYGEDGGTHCMYKFVADVAGDLSKGTVYTLSLGQALVNGEPSGNTAKWILVPNATQSDRNNMSAIAASVGGTNFNGIEDCDISPIDGKVYFASKGNGRVYRFTDGASVNDFETFVGGMSYNIYTKDAMYTEAWGGGNDNLAFDDKGNMWVCQDGDNNYIWVVRPDHSQSAPKVEIFGSMPAGGEPTGLTFSPDYRFGFVSVQHPNGNNALQRDAAEKDVAFDKSATIVFALQEDLGSHKPVAGFKADTTVVVAGNNVVFTDTSKYYPTSREWLFDGGTPGTSTDAAPVVVYRTPGTYDVTLVAVNAGGEDSLTKKGYIVVKDTTITDPDDDYPAQTIRIYPNPTHGDITVEFKLVLNDNVSIELFDLMGRRLGHLAKIKATGEVQRLHFNLERYAKSSQTVLMVIKSEHKTIKRLIFFTR